MISINSDKNKISLRRWSGGTANLHSHAPKRNNGCNTKSIWRQLSSASTANSTVIITHRELVQCVRSILDGRSAVKPSGVLLELKAERCNEVNTRRFQIETQSALCGCHGKHNKSTVLRVSQTRQTKKIKLSHWTKTWQTQTVVSI